MSSIGPGRARLLGLVLAACALVVAGCTGVPLSSQPQVIQSQQLEQPDLPANAPTPGLDPRSIVRDFLDANSANDANHTTARLYLTPSERARWSDETAVVVDTTQIGAADKDGVVTVDGSKLGSVDANGVYTPALLGEGGGQSIQLEYRTKQVHGQWRIDKLAPGLLVTSDQFQARFQQRSIYFYDAAEQALVPDPRFTQLLDRAELADFLVRALAVGPQDALSAAEVTELPTQADPARLVVAVSSDASEPARIAVPGAAQFDGAGRTKLATQLAATLAQVADIGSTRELSILDGGEAVSIPRLGTTFTASDFAAEINPPRPQPALYYVNDAGGVVNSLGTPLPGRIGSGYYDLTSVGLAADRTSDGLLVAGTRGKFGAETFDVGSESTPLKPVPKVTGLLSRPSWSPDRPEVWIGAGTKLYRVSSDATATVVPIATAKGPAPGQVVAVRFSPEGTRVALVLQTQTPDGDPVSTAWVGVVVRGSGKVRVEGLTQVTPNGIVLADVAWNDELKLYAVGHGASSGVKGIYEVQCDGSRWSAGGIGVLPDQPDSITVAEGQVVAVSATGLVYRQEAGTWIGIRGVDTAGVSPIYVV